METKDKLGMDLQYFADGSEDNSAEDGKNTDPNDGADGKGNPDSSDNSQKQNDSKTGSGKTYTEDDLKKIVEDKKAQWQEKTDNAKKLEKMSVDQKNKFLLDQAKKEAEESKKELAKYHMQDTARGMAKDAGIELNSSDIKHIVTSDADTTKSNIDWLSRYTNRLKKHLKADLLKGNPPKTNGSKVHNKTESVGARLAKQNHAHKENHYFK